MKRKRYEVRGMMEWHPVFKVGRSRMQVSFTGGHLCGGAATAASFETSDPVVQAVIEASKAYESKLITLGREWEVERDRVSTAALVSERTQMESTVGAAVSMTALHEELQRMEFRDEIEAGDFLQKEKGIPVDRVVTAPQCIAEAKELGIDMIIKK